MWHQPASLIIHGASKRSHQTPFESLHLPQSIIATHMRLVLGVSFAIHRHFVVFPPEFSWDLQRTCKSPAGQTWTERCFDSDLQHWWQRSMHVRTVPMGICKTIRMEQLAQHIDWRNANEVPTKLWNYTGFHRSPHNKTWIDHFRSTSCSQDMVQSDDNDDELCGKQKGVRGCFCKISNRLPLRLLHILTQNCSPHKMRQGFALSLSTLLFSITTCFNGGSHGGILTLWNVLVSSANLWCCAPQQKKEKEAQWRQMFIMTLWPAKEGTWGYPQEPMTSPCRLGCNLYSANLTKGLNGAIPATPPKTSLIKKEAVNKALPK